MLVELIIGGKEAGPNELRMCKAPTFSALSRTLRHRLFKEGVQLSPPQEQRGCPPAGGRTTAGDFVSSAIKSCH